MERCPNRDNENCPAGKKDDRWFIGYIYCDHYDWHEHWSGCDIKCKFVSEKPRLNRRKK